MTEIRTTSETGGQKGVKLARFDLIPPQQLWRLAEHYGRGAQKYDDDNYRKGYQWKHSIAALDRHIAQFKMGEDYDEETGSLHIIAAAWHCFTLAEFFDVHPEYDTRLKTIEQRGMRWPESLPWTLKLNEQLSKLSTFGRNIFQSMISKSPLESSVSLLNGMTRKRSSSSPHGKTATTPPT